MKNILNISSMSVGKTQSATPANHLIALFSNHKKIKLPSCTWNRRSTV